MNKTMENMDEYEFYNLQNLPCVIGNPPVEYIEKGYPSDILSFGEGQQTGEHTHLEFTMPLSYAGEFKADDGVVYDLFRFPESGITGRDLFNARKPIYLMLENYDENLWFLFRPRDVKKHTVKKLFNKYMPKNRAQVCAY